MIEIVAKGANVRGAIEHMKTIEPKMYNALRKDLRSALSGLASQVGSAFPASAPLSGMRHLGRTSYIKPNASVSFTPGRSRRGGTTSLMGIRVKIPKTSVGAWLGEMAGMRAIVDDTGTKTRPYAKYGSSVNAEGNPYQHRRKAQGAYLIDRINRRQPMRGRGGRYGWAEFVQGKPEVREKGLRILNRLVDELNRSES